MISSLVWVPAGVADPKPKKYELSTTEQELVQMLEQQGISDPSLLPTATADAKQKTKAKKKKEPSIPNTLPADLRMDEYSSDEDDAAAGSALGNMLMGPASMEEEEIGREREVLPKSKRPVKGDDSDDDDDDDDLADVLDMREYTPIDVEGLQAMGMSHVGSNTPVYMGDDDVDDESDINDVNLSPDDALIVIAKTEEDFASLEVHVYEPKSGNMFVHHDIPLPAFPLCLAHGDVSPGGAAGNFCAVGTFSPGIEVWNLDVLNALEPSCILGGEDTSMADDLMKYNMMNGPQKGVDHAYTSSSSGGLREGSHTDAIMALSWNTVHRQVIASGSADCTVKLWDVTKGAIAGTFNHHKDKVQSVAWHPQEGTLLATGGYDRTVALIDARASSDAVRKVKIPGDCESIAWDPHKSQYLTVASEDGTINCWDVRKFVTNTPAWSFVANEFGGVSDISYNPMVPGMMVSCSTNKMINIYDANTEGVAPTLCGSKDMKVGKLYTVAFYQSSPWLLACGGGGNELALWDMTREASIQNKFGSRAIGAAESIQTASESTADFEAMMTSPSDKAGEEAAKPSETREPKKNGSKNKKKKKGGGNKKKKAHKVR